MRDLEGDVDKDMQLKKISKPKLSALIIILSLFVFIFYPFNYSFAQGAGEATGETAVADPPKPAEASDVASSDCGYFDFACKVTFSLLGVLGDGLVELTYWVGVMPTNALIIPAGFIFDIAVYESTDGANYPIDADNGIYAGWRVFRDMVNMVFIFIVIYIGIRTILQIGGRGERQLLIYVIIVALLINFSLVITGVVIDASNILALGLYDQLETETDTRIAADAKTLSGVFLQGANPLTAQAPAVFNATADAPSDASSPGFWKSLLGNIGAIIVNLVVIFVLLVAGVLFFIRIPVLWLIMVLSPLAFAAYIMGGTRRYFNEWLHALLNNAFFAPIFMALFFAVAAIYNSAAFRDVGNIAGQTITAFLLKYFIVVTLLVGCLIIAKKLGTYGATTIINRGKGYAKRTGSFAGSHTIGRSASAIRDSDRMKQFVARNPRIGNLALRPLEGIEKARFGGSGKDSYKSRKDAAVKRGEGLADYVSKDKRGEPVTVTRIRGTGEIDEKTGKEKVKEEIISGKEAYVEALGKQRKLPALSSLFKFKKQNSDIEKTFGKVKTTIGGKQTRIDRETLLKILSKKEGGKGGGRGIKEGLEELLEKFREGDTEGLEEGLEELIEKSEKGGGGSKAKGGGGSEAPKKDYYREREGGGSPYT